MTGEHVVRPVYHATAERDGKFWFIRVPELERVYAQARRLDQSEDAIREVIALRLDVPEDSFDVFVHPVIDRQLRDLIGELGDRRREYERAQEELTLATRGIAAYLHTALALTVRDIGAVLDLSPQRVSQILATARARERLNDQVAAEVERAMEERAPKLVDLMAALNSAVEEAKAASATTDARHGAADRRAKAG